MKFNIFYWTIIFWTILTVGIFLPGYEGKPIECLMIICIALSCAFFGGWEKEIQGGGEINDYR